ncbi:MAG TPA: toll/interleukin-1 receptor domain-containing protein [Aggregatilineales bacterium]|nr:toll/interleukin-1 receptor domain-containing protein [Aggregatilineales bacterium]
MMSVFVSYSRHDKDFVVRLVHDLRAREIDVWLDVQDIAPGQRWDKAIENALDRATHVIFVMSKTSVQSDNVRDEIDVAIDSGKTVLPILLEDCTPPLRTRRIEYTDFRTDYESGLRQLLTFLGIGHTASTAISQNPPRVPVVPAARGPAGRTLLLLGGGGLILVLVTLLVMIVLRLPAFTGPGTSNRTPSEIVVAASTEPTEPPTETPSESGEPPTETPSEDTPAATMAGGTSIAIDPSGTCANGIQSRLKIAGRGRVAFRAALTPRLKARPDYNSFGVDTLGVMYPGDTFIVLNGPTCSKGGQAFWNVGMDVDDTRKWNGETGWALETNPGGADEYVLEPLDNTAGTMRSNLNGWPPSSALWKAETGGRFFSSPKGDTFFMSSDTDNGQDFDYICHMKFARHVDYSALSLVFRASHDPNQQAYIANMNTTKDGGLIKLFKFYLGQYLELGTFPVTLNVDDAHELKAVVGKQGMDVYFDGEAVIHTPDNSGTPSYTSGHFGIDAYNADGYAYDCNAYIHPTG